MNGYLAPDVPAKQWEVVGAQLAELRNGDPPAIWQAVGDALIALRDVSGLYSVTLLDAGCSSAYFSEVIDHYVPKWVAYKGMDFSPHMIGEAAQRYPYAMVDLSDMRQTCYKDRSFDIVMTGATLNHIVEWRRALKELARIVGRYLLFHRLPFVDGPTRIDEAIAYGHPVPALFFNELEFGIVLSDRGFVRIYDESVDDLRTQIWERA